MMRARSVGRRSCLAPDQLECDRAFQLLVVRPIDDAHAARAEKGGDPEVAQCVTDHLGPDRAPGH